MTPPCACNHCNPDPTALYTSDQCRLYWLYHHVLEYRQLWDGVTVAQQSGCCGDGHGNNDADLWQD